MRLLKFKWVVLVAAAAVGGAALAQPHPSMMGADVQGRADDLEKMVEGDLHHVKHLQEVARKQRDIIKLTCVNDKFIQVKAAANVFDQTRQQVELLTLSGPAATLGQLGQQAEAVHKLRAEADTCLGEPELIGESSNGYANPYFPDDPTLGNPFGPGVEPARLRVTVQLTRPSRVRSVDHDAAPSCRPCPPPRGSRSSCSSSYRGHVLRTR